MFKSASIFTACTLALLVGYSANGLSNPRVASSTTPSASANQDPAFWVAVYWLGKDLLVASSAMRDDVVFVNGKRYHAILDPIQPFGVLVRKAGKHLEFGDTVTIQFNAPDGTITPPYIATPLRTITLSAADTKVRLRVGQPVFVALGEALYWRLDPLSNAVLGFGDYPPALLIRGAQAMLLAQEAGQVTLSLTGAPSCSVEVPPCDAPSTSFECHVIVE